MADKKISQLTGASTPLAGTEVLPIVQSGSTVKVPVADLTAGRSVAMSGLEVSNTGASNYARVTAASTYAAGVSLAGNGNTHLTTGSLIYQDSSNRLNFLNYPNASLRIGTNNAFQLTIAGTGNVSVATGDLVIGTAGKGIDFSANTGAAGETSSLLDWYEEGTWTPSVAAGAISGTGITYTGTYTRIGRVLYINLKISATASDLQVSSYVEFSGLPFTVFNGSSGVVTSEDIDLTSSNGFATAANARLTLGACGSPASTNTLKVTVVAYIA